ncbi:zinc knuckle CX2CX4HX4C containing protein [Tanacetum coccineum]
MEKKDAPNKYDGLGDSLLERMRRSREIRDASLKQSRPTSPDGHGTKPNSTQSFASVLQTKSIKKVVKITELRNDERVEGAAVALPFKAVEEVSARFNNTLYGYFIGKRLAFKLVENYVKNTWAKYGLKRVQLHDDFFLFQFENKDGMDKVLENGPWLIRTVPLILNVWSPNTDLKKAEVKKAPVSRYARALIEVSADKEILESLTIAILVGKDKGHTLVTIDIEYEWKPPQCSHCLIFDHITDKCSKMPKETIPNTTDDKGFVEVKKKKNKNKSKP